MTLALDAANVGHVGVSFDQGLVILQLGALAGTLDSTAVGRIGTPETNVTVVRSREHVFAIRCEFCGEHTITKISLLYLISGLGR